ncbi:MAG: RNA polymerase sigma-70 factor [Bacteroidales bacterium]
MLNDMFVLAKIKEGDIKAFEELFRLYYSPLCWYVTGITGNVDAAQEIVDELFYTLWKRRKEIQVFHSVKSYLYGAVRNEAFAYCEHLQVRNRYRDKVLAAGDKRMNSTPQEQMEYEELQRLIHKILGQLPQRRFTIFKMHRMDGKKYAEIASALSLSVKTVEAEMTKTLKILRTEIEKYIHTT